MGIRVTHFPFADANHMNAWVAWCPNSREGILVDPGAWDDRLTEWAGMVDLKITGILLTHSHWDHTGGLAESVEKLDAPVMASAAALDVARGGMKTMKEQALAEGDRIDIGGHDGVVHEVPGHVDDQIVVHVDGHLLAGDTLFAAALGGTSSEEAFHVQIGRLRRLLYHLPPATVVHPGHGPATEVGLELLFNPFLKGTEPKWKTARGGW